MNDYEMMNQRVDQLREELALLNHKQVVLDSLKADVMAELLDTCRQITKADKLKIKFGFFIEGRSETFKGDAFNQMNRLSTSISDVEWTNGPDFQAVSWNGIPKPLAPVDHLDM